MKVLITGICGFVGPYLAKEFSDHSYDVYGFDAAAKNISSAKTFSVDILDKKKVFSVVSEIKPDYIVHLAAVSSVKKSMEEPELTNRVNVIGTKNLLDAVINAKINPRILVVSSAEVYGDAAKIPTDENCPLNPSNPYAKSRVEQEKLCMDYFKNKGLQIIISRSYNHTGPGQLDAFVCPDFAKQVVEARRGIRKEMTVGDLAIKRDFCDVRDVVRAYRLALEKAKIGEIYNIGSGNSYSIGDILNMLINISKAKIKIHENKNKLKGKRAKEMQCNSTKFRKATSWKPEIDFRKTLADILQYWEKELSKTTSRRLVVR